MAVANTATNKAQRDVGGGAFCKRGKKSSLWSTEGNTSKWQGYFVHQATIFSLFLSLSEPLGAQGTLGFRKYIPQTPVSRLPPPPTLALNNDINL